MAFIVQWLEHAVVARIILVQFQVNAPHEQAMSSLVMTILIKRYVVVKCTIYNDLRSGR